MNLTRLPICLVCLVCWMQSTAQARLWSDATGDVAMESELVGMNDHHVLLRRPDGELGIAEIDQLSDEDRDYLKSDEARTIHDKNFNPVQVWTTTDGIELRGHIVDFVSWDVTIQRRRGHMYVNDRRFPSLPDFYRQMTTKIIEHFDDVELPNPRAVQNWLRGQQGRLRTFPIDGVLLETETGDEYAIPFFALSPGDQQLLRPYWSEWQAWRNDQQDREHDQQRRQYLAFRLESMAAAHLQNQEQLREIAQVNLKLQAVRAGVTSLWEVTLYPDLGNPHPPMWVVVPGRNSNDAVTEARSRYPGFVVGPVRRVSR